MVAESREARIQAHDDLRVSIGHLDQSVSTMNALMEDVRTALTGDELGNPGMVHRQNDIQGQVDEERGFRVEGDKRLHARLDSFEYRLNRIIWIAVGVGVGSGIGSMSLFRIFGWI